MSSTKRSYLDTLNAGRQRRPSSALEELNRSLEGFEQRLDRHRDEAAEFLREPLHYAEDTVAGRQREEYRYVPPAPRQHVAGHAPDRSRAPDEGLATLGRIAVDLKSLRDEVRFQTNHGMKREFDSLRREMERGVTPAPAADLSGEFERLATMIKTITSTSNDGVVSALRVELDQVRSALESLERVDAERDQRWQALEERVSAGNATPAMESLHERIAEVGQSLARLPDSLPLRGIEERMRTLATAIDHFSRQERHGGEAYAAIDARLEEISRAIVATSASMPAAVQDPAP
ncbi:MAG: peptidoglycan-binding protein, partial [Rhizobiaceae bacterium]|nr:peptidoglycan-binding protein [Rhizobiaceae bacterium]